MAEVLATVAANVALATGASAGTALAVGTFVANYGLLIGGLAYSVSAQNKAKRKARQAFNDAQQDRLVNLVTTTGPRELVLGRVRKGGHVFFKGSAGDNKTTFVMCIALAAHEIDAVETTYLNGQAVTLDGSGYVQEEPYLMGRRENDTATANGSGVATLANTPIAGTVTAYIPSGDEGGSTSPATVVSVVGTTVTTVTPGCTVQYQYTVSSPKARIRFYLGTSSQTADSRLMTLFPTLWTSAHRGRGVAYAICEYTYDETAFPSSLPVATFLIRGAKCYDPRTATTIWSENPAVQARHVLTHAQFGKRTSITADEDTRITTAANACDTSTTYTVAGVGQPSRALYKSGMVAEYGRAPADVLNALTQAMAGQWCFQAGQFYIRAGTYSASVLSLTEADLAVEARGADGAVNQRAVNISTHRARDQMFNVVAPTIWDSAQDYKANPLTPLKSSALITRDGNKELVRDVMLEAVGYAPQALHIAGIMMRDARDPLTASIPFKLTAYRAEVFDTISLTIARYGWSAKTFMVVSREWAGDGHIRLTLKEVAASIYTMDASFSAQGGASNTALTSPWDLPDITITVTSGSGIWLVQSDGRITSRARVTWSAITDSAVTQGGQVEVQWREAAGTGAWSSVVVSGAETQALIDTGILDARHYIFRARTRSSVAVGDWSASVAHQIAQLPQGSIYGTILAVDEKAVLGGAFGGTKSGFTVVGSGSAAILEGTGAQSWSNVSSTWGGWSEWNSSPTSPATYTSEAQDLGRMVAGQVEATVDGDGTAVVEVRTSDDGVTWTAWGTYSTPFYNQHVQVRVTVTGGDVSVRSFLWQVRGALLSESVTDLDITQVSSTYRIGTGDIYLPVQQSYTMIRTAIVTHINDADPTGWSWHMTDVGTVIVGPSTPGPRFKLFYNGVAADPDSASFYIEGY